MRIRLMSTPAALARAPCAGTMFLAIEGTDASPRVRRVR
jgi:hypothetical protein